VTENEWRWWPEGQRVVQILAEQSLFGEITLDVYSPAEGRVFSVGPTDLAPLHQRTWAANELSARALAMRVLAEAQAGQPIAAGARVDLLPHQVAILQRAQRLSPLRLAVCCEVGLGKTTTAGAILTEFLARGRIGRVLVVAPKGVQLQWVAEMQDKFGLEFTRIGPEGVPIDPAAAVWRAFDRVVTSLDAIKPLRRRAGWTQQQLEAYNATRAHAATSAGWDLVIIDEAHHVAGSSVDVARHQLALDLAARTPNLLLLTATPHSGKSESFRRFLGLLDEGFRRGREINTATVAAVVARTDKRNAVDHAGKPLFHSRTTLLEVVPWDGHPLHRDLYEAVTDYVREGYVAARASGDSARGFLMLLFQRLVASSTSAIIAALEKRLDNLNEPEDDNSDALPWDELDDEISGAVLRRRSLPDVDRLELVGLLDVARRTLSAESDPKTVHFLRLLRRIQRDENDPDVKILVFTQFRATQQSLVRVLEAQGLRTVTVDGAMGIAERAVAQATFRNEAQVLVSTDAGGEGVNLQFAHVVVNWDLPWTPTLLEQRIGRVDRIGQSRPVRAFNFVLYGSVDQRVLEVLEAKLALILAELGVDKRSEVLAAADVLSDDLYVAAIVAPESFDEAAEQFIHTTRQDLAAAASDRQILAGISVVPPRVPPSEVPELVARLQRLTNGDANGALRGSAVVAPGEPVARVALGSAGGWLAVGRVGQGARTGSVGAFAVFLPDGGRPDPIGGRSLLERLTKEEFGSLESEAVPPDVHASLVAALTDFSYQHLRDLGGGVVPKLPSLRLALVVRFS
jgi:superfamily II DNA or RNA helicase